MSTASYKCPNCGAGLKFDPELQKSKCEYCKSEFTNAELEGMKRGIDDNSEQGSVNTQFRGYICSNCGAEVVTDETTSATLCYYCHNPVLLTDRLTGEFQPTRIIPFTYDREKAVESFLSWVRSMRFVPKEFCSTSQLENITGIYVPYWMADVSGEVEMLASAVNTRVWKTEDTEYTEHNQYKIRRQGEIDINNIREIALKRINKGLLDSISPYDESKAVDFSMSYLSGFFAEKYDIPKEDVQPGIIERAKEYASYLVDDTVGSYDKLTIERNNANISVKTWNYILMPVWILTYTYNEKTYVYAVNGQTGESYGELPLDRKKLRIVTGVIAAAIFAFTLVGGLLIW